MMKEPKLGSNKIQSFIDFFTTLGNVRFGLEGLALFYEKGTTKVYLTDSSGRLADAAVTTAKIAALAVTYDKIADPLSVKTVKTTIGGVGVADCDFNFVTAANMTEQPIDLGAIVPVRARVMDIFVVTEAAFTGAISLSTDVGNATGGAQFIAAADIIAANAVLAAAVASAPLVAPNVAATKVWVNSTPGANWSLVTAGKMTVYITYIDVTNI